MFKALAGALPCLGLRGVLDFPAEVRHLRTEEPVEDFLVSQWGAALEPSSLSQPSALSDCSRVQEFGGLAPGGLSERGRLPH